SAIRLARPSAYGWLDVLRLANLQLPDFHPQAGCRRLEGLHEMSSRTGGDVRIEQDRDAREMRRNLLEQFEPFRRHRRFEVVGEAGSVAARTGETFDESASDRV